MGKTKSGPQLLAEWIDSGGRKQGWVADQINVGPQALTKWLNGERSPQIVYRFALERLTDGAVPVAAWLERVDG
jgi:hypothetical protein